MALNAFAIGLVFRIYGGAHGADLYADPFHPFHKGLLFFCKNTDLCCSIMLSNWVRTEIKYGIARATDINISANNPVT